MKARVQKDETFRMSRWTAPAKGSFLVGWLAWMVVLGVIKNDGFCLAPEIHINRNMNRSKRSSRGMKFALTEIYFHAHLTFVLGAKLPKAVRVSRHSTVPYHQRWRSAVPFWQWTIYCATISMQTLLAGLNYIISAMKEQISLPVMVDYIPSSSSIAPDDDDLRKS